MNQFKSFQEAQGILSVGYIYLIVMGILNQTLFYGQLGVNILNYSSILDVLISPIAKITSSLLGTAIMCIILLVTFNLPRILAKQKDKNWLKNSFNLNPNATTKEVEGTFTRTFLILISVGLLGFFVGSGIGGGKKLSLKIKNGELEYNDELVFINGDFSKVEIIGKNSSYIFYLEKGMENVKTSPIEGILKSIKEVP